MIDYNDFLESKLMIAEESGFDVDKSKLNSMAFEWQKDIVKWALKKGKCCLFEDCGLGKTLQQLMYSDEVCKYTGGNVLIFAPLAVASQTQLEGQKFGINVNICRTQKDVRNGINITNYEMLEHFEPRDFVGVVLDESSILKNNFGHICTHIIKMFGDTPYKLCCTATPAPNDFVEIATHAEFLGIMSRSEMLSTFFIHDGGDTSKWRLKRHAVNNFFKWVSSWAVCMTSPTDLGYSAEDYLLPDLKIVEHIVKTNDFEDASGQTLLFPQITMDLNERRKARRMTVKERVMAAAEIANSHEEQTIVWCDYNEESALLAKQIHDSVEITGSDDNEKKSQSMLDFSCGRIKCLISKPKIAGWGMNWQNCHNIIYVGLSDSFESYYQTVRRCYRFGQKNPVIVHIIISDKEQTVKSNIERKQSDMKRMVAELTGYTKNILKTNINHTGRICDDYINDVAFKPPMWIGG